MICTGMTSGMTEQTQMKGRHIRVLDGNEDKRGNEESQTLIWGKIACRLLKCANIQMKALVKEKVGECWVEGIRNLDENTL